MSSVFQSKMTTSRYRRVLALLNQLNDYHRIAKTAGCEQLAEGISHVVEFFERGNKDDVLARGKRKAVSLDDLGRSYSLGKRKTSAARVWMIPVRVDEATTSPGQPTQSKESVEDILGIERLSSSPTRDAKIAVPTSTILINNIPLSEYFSSSTDRERIVRPLKIAGVLGAYNVFALVRGGGTTGQAGAVAHGISKGLVIHEPGLDTVLRRCEGFFHFLQEYSLTPIQLNCSDVTRVWLSVRKLVLPRQGRGYELFLPPLCPLLMPSPQYTWVKR